MNVCVCDRTFASLPHCNIIYLYNKAFCESVCLFPRVSVSFAFYASDKLSEAKCFLWSHFEDSNLLEPMQTRLTSCNRTDREATSDDILRGIGSLIENGIKVQCVTRDWKLIPKSHPEGLNELTLAEKPADLEGKLKVLVDSVDGTKSDAATNSQKISALETDSKLHGQLIQQVLVKTNDHNAKYPSLAEVVVGGSSIRPLPKTGGTNRDWSPDSNGNDQCERKLEADREAQPIPVPPRIDSTTQQLHDTFVIPADQRRKQKKQSQKENRSKQPRNTQMRGTIVGQGIDAAGVTMVSPPDIDFIHRTWSVNFMNRTGSVKSVITSHEKE